MTLRPEDFVVTWQQDDVKPASYTEVISAMETINTRAAKTPDGDGIVEVTLRQPVAIAVAEGINSISPGTAQVDVGQDPRFVPEKGGYQSRLTVANTAERMADYINSF